MKRLACALLTALHLLAQPPATAPQAPPQTARDPRSLEASALYKQARAIAANDPAAAIELYRKALALREATGERFDEALTAHNLASAYWTIGANDDALPLFQRALAIRTELNDTVGLGYTHYAIAITHWTWGDAEAALASYDRALALWREQNNIAGQADVLNATGLALMSLGEPARAEERYRQALPLWQKAKHAAGEGYTRSNLGMLQFAARRHDAAAVEYSRALELLTAAKDNRGIAYVRHNQGDLAAARGQFAAAIESYQASLASKRAVDDKYGIALTLTRLAEAQRAGDDWTAALNSARESLALQRATGNRTGETATLAVLARIAGARGDRAEALAYAAQAVELSETTRAALSNNELRTSYFATQRQLYAQLIALQLEGGLTEAALETSERSRARVLLDAVSDERIALPEAGAGERRALERQIRAAVERRNTKAADELLHRWAALDAKLRAGNTAGNAAPATVAAIRGQLLDPDTALIEYFAGDDRGHAWLLTEGQVQVIPLPARSVLETQVRRYRQALTARGDAKPGETAEARAARIAAADATLSAAARALSDALLVPLARHIRAKRLLIIPDGPLHQLPFAALPLAGGLLLDRAEVVTLPSASVALQLRSRPASGTAGSGLAIVADPAFDANWAPLPMTALEARAIRKLAPAARALTGPDATRAALLQPSILGASILHLATHARAESEHPALARIALAGGGQLTLADIYGMPLRSRLVVLSGCETALGREVAGEGPVGLARAFFYAGARTVVASLWNVQDRATAELMRHFYQGLLTRRLSPSAALRRAQLTLRNDSRWTHAYYWAPFLIGGDWR
ncbi:MAG: CHAT domain-containing protein [Bryobacterales bacterium]|nr:CHAT domain-containing protein [Bryobacterales bacterium]